MKRILTFLALCLPLYLLAQGFGGFANDQPFFARDVSASSPDTPEYLATFGLRHRWVFSDLTNNVPVTNWIDRINGSIWTNGATANRATNSSDGVYFDSAHYLTNNWQEFYTNVTFGFIVNIVDADNGGQVFPMILANTEKSTESQAYSYMFQSSGYGLAVKTGNTANMITQDPYPIQGIMHTLLFDQVRNPTNNRTFVWTNDIFANDTATSAWEAVSTNRPYTLGFNRFRTSGPRMFIKEFWIWTNNYPDVIQIPASVRSNWHYYATNTYGFSP